MGKPYQKELDQLADTYRWAMTFPAESICAAARSLSPFPLLAVGSGGSFTTADFAASLHREITGNMSSALTPMEAVATGVDFRSTAVLLTTAGGRNPDVLGAFKKIVAHDPRKFVVLCTSLRTPLARLAAEFQFVDFVEVELPSRKDGFLATNSLLGSTILLARGYAEAVSISMPLPTNLQGFLNDSHDGIGFEDYARRCRPLWKRDTLIVLYGPATRSAAIDLESKFTEAALGNVQIADYRNFAHGRHHWLAKRSKDSAILAFLTPDDQKTGSATLDLIPKVIPQLRVPISFRGILANLAALVHGLHIVGSAGQAHGIDPGKPGVPGFGRKIYHLAASEYANRKSLDVAATEAVALERKSGKSISKLAEENQLAFWRAAYSTFLQCLRQTVFQAVVFDYDGTLCGEQDRFYGLTPIVGRHLTRLVKAGIPVGIATGRGQSVRKALRESIPKQFWGRVLIGYYNGGDLGLLSDDLRPDGTEGTCEALAPVATALQGHATLSKLAKFEFRLPQIKVEPKMAADSESVWGLLVQLVHRLGIPAVSVLRSSHSMDVLAPGVTKQKVIDAVAEMNVGPASPSILCIGDRGQWPGNDFVLLSGPWTLSVDEVSQDPDACWNLAPPGFRSIQACLHYLDCLKVISGQLAFCDAPVKRSKP